MRYVPHIPQTVCDPFLFQFNFGLTLLICVSFCWLVIVSFWLWPKIQNGFNKFWLCSLAHFLFKTCIALIQNPKPKNDQRQSFVLSFDFWVGLTTCVYWLTLRQNNYYRVPQETDTRTHAEEIEMDARWRFWCRHLNIFIYRCRCAGYKKHSITNKSCVLCSLLLTEITNLRKVAREKIVSQFHDNCLVLFDKVTMREHERIMLCVCVCATLASKSFLATSCSTSYFSDSNFSILL